MRLPKQLSEATKKMTKPFWRNLKKHDSFQILEIMHFCNIFQRNISPILSGFLGGWMGGLFLTDNEAK